MPETTNDQISNDQSPSDQKPAQGLSFGLFQVLPSNIKNEGLKTSLSAPAAGGGGPEGEGGIKQPTTAAATADEDGNNVLQQILDMATHAAVVPPPTPQVSIGQVVIEGGEQDNKVRYNSYCECNGLTFMMVTNYILLYI